VLSHPLRPRILSLLAARGEASPNELASELGVPLGTLSYHIRLLRDLGWIELAHTKPRRGAVEHFYRPVVRSLIDDLQWERLPVSVRRRLSSLTVEQILRSAATAATEGGFDRPGAYVVRTWLELDEQGWHELSDALMRVLEEAGRIQDRSNERRTDRSADAVEGSELALLHFAARTGAF
jgi:DNA-binding transcriptional ArsR family regulator